MDVALALPAEDDPGAQDPPLPDAALVWWRAQVRARDEAVRLAARPITIAQAAALAATVGVGGAIFGATASWFQTGVRWLGAALAASGASLGETAATTPAPLMALLTGHLYLVIAGTTTLILAPVAVYLALVRD
jgi:hypothetical protein